MNKIEEFFDNKASSWDSKEKITQARLNQLLDLLPITSNMKICDLGCGTGIISGLLEALMGTITIHLSYTIF